MRKLLSLLLLLAVIASLTSCAFLTFLPSEDTPYSVCETTSVSDRCPLRGGYYYDLESVVLYLDAYGKLPDNFITKKEASALGWTGGTPESVRDGAAIGGDKFGNREGHLPKSPGRIYFECDIDTNGASSRGAKRLVYSSDGLYFYTDDHYATFTELYVSGGRVIKK